MTDKPTTKLFGTDGIRGKANHPPLDAQTIVDLGTVLGALIREQVGENADILLGHDGRISAAMIRAALTAGLLSEGVGVFDGGLMTTPALAHETRLGEHAAGIMISASHNPADDNGIKIFGRNGRKIADQMEEVIEQRMHETPIARPHRRPGNARRLALGAASYRRFIEEAFAGLELARWKILIDCANGGSSVLAPDIFASFGATVVARNHEPDGTNINDGCGALHPDRVAAEVAEHGCDLGLCLDGDGDRAIFIDNTGRTVHGDAILTLLALELHAHGRLAADGVAVTVMSNLGLKKALTEQGIRVVETPVGDRSVMAAMDKEGLTLGGENSGHIIFGTEHHFTGDGIYTGLKLLGLLQEAGRPLSEMKSCFQAFPQLLVNVPVREKPKLMSLPLVVEAVRRTEEDLNGEGRVVLRYSGTENLCRVMVEAPTDEIVRTMVERLVTAVKASLGA